MAEHKKTTKKAAAPKAKAPAAPKKKKVEEAPKPAVHAAKPEVKPVEAKPAAPVHHAPVPAAKKVRVETTPRLLPAGEKYYGTGRRKEATAKVWLVPGSGKMTFNGKSLKDYFCGRRLLEFIINRPFAATQLAGKFDVYAELLGGGVPSQADAIRMGIARALVVLNPALKTVLKREGLLTRDPRMKERKKYGLKRARRAFQYTKR